MYHLHGSLNWKILEGTDKINVELGAIRPTFNRSGTNICLVPPGIKELPIVLKHIWGVAKHRLLHSDELVIIGCSLNPLDTELIDLIKEFINKKSPSNKKVIKVIDKSSNSGSANNYQKLMGDRFAFYPHGFNINGPDAKTKGALEFIFSEIYNNIRVAMELIWQTTTTILKNDSGKRRVS